MPPKNPTPLEWLIRVPASPDEFRHEGKRYRVRFTGEDATHIMLNYIGKDGMHEITHQEVVSLVVRSAIKPSLNSPELFYCLGRHENKVYRVVVYLRNNGLCEPRTAYRLNNVYQIREYENFESQYPRP